MPAPKSMGTRRSRYNQGYVFGLGSSTATIERNQYTNGNLDGPDVSR
jgi:hypothetical protein